MCKLYISGDRNYQTGGETMSNALLIGLASLALIGVPVFVYGLMWALSSENRTDDRPEPPETNRTRRRIPGNDSGGTN